ncbi:MAG: hypothetical protein ACL7BU_01250 [Candidatus Phlomobacter fragariae]
MNPKEHLQWLAAVTVLVAFCSASQDIVFDVYKTDCCPPKNVAPAQQYPFWRIVSVCWF